MKRTVPVTTPTAESPKLSDEESRARREAFMERVLSPDGLDRETLAKIEQLGDEPAAAVGLGSSVGSRGHLARQGGARHPEEMKGKVQATTPTAESKEMSDEDRRERLKALSERLFSPDGLDRETLAKIEQLGDEPE